MLKNLSFEPIWGRPAILAVAGVLVLLACLIRLVVIRFQKPSFPYVIAKNGSVMEALVEGRNKVMQMPPTTFHVIY